MKRIHIPSNSPLTLKPANSLSDEVDGFSLALRNVVHVSINKYRHSVLDAYVGVKVFEADLLQVIQVILEKGYYLSYTKINTKNKEKLLAKAGRWRLRRARRTKTPQTQVYFEAKTDTTYPASDI